MYFQDFDLCKYHSGPLDAACWRAPLLAIGWLEHPYNYNHGQASQDLLIQLQALVSGAKKEHPHHNFRGLHHCSLCAADGGHTVGLPSSHVNILVPGSEAIYAAPAGIIHYIQAHSYLPPIEFNNAVSLCPRYGSIEFYETLRTLNHGEPPPIESWEESLRTTREAAFKAIQARDQINGRNA